jgi:Family of unknown function (DUF5338)
MVTPPNRMKGSGRIAFLAQKNEIASELKAGWPIKASYLARAEKLGIGYLQFTRYVEVYIPADQRSVPRPRRARTATADATSLLAPDPVLPPPISPAIEETRTNARHEPRPRTFVYDGNPRQDDKARLVGPSPRDPKT